MSRDELEPLVNSALEALYEQELDILVQDVGERTICGSLACLLRPHFPGFRTHVEYNRRGSGVDPKNLEWPDGDGQLTLQRVFPDIIVHQPGHDRSNLLVIEVKKSTNSCSDEHDHAKLRQLCDQLRYQNGLFLRLRTGPGAALQGVVREWFVGPPAN